MPDLIKESPDGDGAYYRHGYDDSHRKIEIHLFKALEVNHVVRHEGIDGDIEEKEGEERDVETSVLFDGTWQKTICKVFEITASLIFDGLVFRENEEASHSD